MSKANWKTPTYTEAEILAKVRAMRPESNPVSADHDDMASLCDGEPWHVFFDSEDAAPERLIFEPRPTEKEKS